MAAPLATDDEVALCTREHTACNKKKGGRRPEYKLFSAAAEGCLQCVRYYVERADIPYNAKSENSGYTALDFAQWAASREQTDTQAVQQYLESCAQRHARGPEVVPAAQGPVSERAPGEEDIHVAQGLVPELPPGRTGSCTPERHASANSSSDHGTVDMFNGAAYDGCGECVKHWVQVGHLLPLQKYSSYSAVEWAKHGADKGEKDGNMDRLRRCSWVLGFLEAVAWSRYLPPLAEEGAQQIYGIGAQLLEKGATASVRSSRPFATPEPETAGQRSPGAAVSSSVSQTGAGPASDPQSNDAPRCSRPGGPQVQYHAVPPPQEQQRAQLPISHLMVHNRLPGDTTGLGYSQGTGRGQSHRTHGGARTARAQSAAPKWVPRARPSSST